MGTNGKSHLNVRKSVTAVRVVKQRGCGVSVLRDVRDLTGPVPEQPAAGHPALEGPLASAICQSGEALL